MSKSLKKTKDEETFIRQDRKVRMPQRIDQKYRNRNNYEETRPTEENYKGHVSQTRPDETMSIREIIHRFTRGLPLDMARTPVYDQEEDLEILEGRDVRTMDLSEIAEYQKSVAERLKIDKQRRLEHLEKKSKASYDKMVADEVAKRLAEQQQDQPKE